MAYIDEVLADSPWAYWPCDDASGLPQDASGNGRHVTGQSHRFDGDDPDYGQPTVLLAEPAGTSIKLNLGFFNFPALNLENTDFTLECWMKIADISDGLELFAQGSFGFTNWLIFTQLVADGAVAFDYWNDRLETTEGLVEVDDYVHIVFRRDHSADTSSIWLNGVKVAEGNQGPKTSASTDFGFGTLGNGGCSQYVGHIAVYESALSDTRILEHYDAGTGDEPPVITCDVQDATSITVGITPTAGASNHAIYVSQDPAFVPDSTSLWDESLGAAPSSFVVETLDEAETYYVIVTAEVGSHTLQSSTLECSTASGGAAPAFVSVAFTTAGAVEFRPEVVSAALEVFYEWQLASETTWTTTIGSTSKTGTSRFVHPASGFTAGVEYRVRVRFRYAAGLSVWTEEEWTQPTVATASTPGNLTAPEPFAYVASPFAVEWSLNTGWSAVALEVSTDGATWDIEASAPASGVTIDPASYPEDAALYVRVEVTDGTTTTYLVTSVIVDTDSSGQTVSIEPASSTWTSALNLESGTLYEDPNGKLWTLNNESAALLAPSIVADATGFRAKLGVSAVASGTTLGWWMNQEIESAEMGIRFVDEDGAAILDFGMQWLSRFPVMGTAADLKGNMLAFFSAPSGSVFSQLVPGGSGGDWCGAPAANCLSGCGTWPCPGAAALSVEFEHVSGDTYDYRVDIVTGIGGVLQQSGTVAFPGGLPCGYVVPYFGRFQSNFLGYTTPWAWGWQPLGTACSAGLPSAPPVTVQEPATTCEINCQCVTLTPDPLLLPSASEIRYEITTKDDPSFASPLYVRDWQPVIPILSDEKFTQCDVPAGNYLGRAIVR